MLKFKLFFYVDFLLCVSCKVTHTPTVFTHTFFSIFTHILHKGVTRRENHTKCYIQIHTKVTYIYIYIYIYDFFYKNLFRCRSIFFLIPKIVKIKVHISFYSSIEIQYLLLNTRKQEFGVRAIKSNIQVNSIVLSKKHNK